MGQVYVHAELPRAGLANMLIPWAGAEVFRHRHGLPMLAPRWVRARIGPIVRRERDPRLYLRQFSSRGYVRGWRRWWVLARASYLEPAEAARGLEDGGDGVRVVRFQSYLGWFEGLGEHRGLIGRRLLEILGRGPRRRLAELREDPVVAVHVRRGDMRMLNKPRLLAPMEWAWTMPEGWYVASIRAVREAAGAELPVTVFSDGRDEELQALLSMPGVVRAARAPAVVDLVRMSRARVLVTTGTSSFSAWAEFLGGMPSVWYRGLSGRFLSGGAASGARFETDFEGRVADVAGLAAAVARREGAVSSPPGP